ncbi:DUF4328 domain-containing protein [Sphingopyxis sp.]|uniref:DUF4328 domain-containing protein n=1 Tax=Sphingopyxis sp. TaxID=1908224 RepID=UPI002ED9DBFB
MAAMTLGDGIDLLQRRAKIVKAMLVGGLALVVPMLIGEIAELQGAINLDNADDIASPAGLYAGVLLANWLLLVATYVVFGMWIYRAAANVDAAMVPGFRYTPSWAVGWYFIPIANFYKPFAAMRQIWNASTGRTDLDHGEPLLVYWWGIWTLTSVASYFAFRSGLNPENAAEARSALEAETFSSVLCLALYPLAWRLVDRITSAQRERLTSAQIFA